jgi:hypothetical protein
VIKQHDTCNYANDSGAEGKEKKRKKERKGEREKEREAGNMFFAQNFQSDTIRCFLKSKLNKNCINTFYVRSPNTDTKRIKPSFKHECIISNDHVC